MTTARTVVDAVRVVLFFVLTVACDSSVCLCGQRVTHSVRCEEEDRLEEWLSLAARDVVEIQWLSMSALDAV